MNKKTTSVSYMCPACNDFSVFNINIFDFSGNRKKTYKCACQESEIAIIKNGTKSFKVEFDCVACNEKHSFVIPHNQFWSNDVFTFSCPFYEANILYVGERNKLEESVRNYISSELGSDDAPSFLPDYSTIENLIELTKILEGNPGLVKVCDCDSKSSLAYNEKAIYMICDSCGKSIQIKYDNIDEFLKTIKKI